MSAPTTCPNLGETHQNFKLQKGIKRPKASPLKVKIKRFKTNRPLSRCARCEEMQPPATCGSTCIFLMWPDLVVCLCASLVLWFFACVVFTKMWWWSPTLVGIYPPLPVSVIPMSCLHPGSPLTLLLLTCQQL